MKTIVVNEDASRPLRSMLTILTERQLLVLHLRLRENLTQAEVARIIGVSQRRVGQIETSAFGILRKERNLILDF